MRGQDRFLWCFLSSSLVAIWLPSQGFRPLLCLLLLGLMWSIWRLHWRFMALFGALFWLFLSLFSLDQQINAVQAQSIRAPIRITQIFSQHEYQTARAVLLEAKAGLAQGSQLYLSADKTQPIELGGEYETKMTLRPISGRLNQGGFDRQKWLISEHFKATASLKSLNARQATPDFRTRLLTHHQQKLGEKMGGGLLLALTFGERAWLKPEWWQLFQQTNTAHLIAISGSHIMLAFALGVGLSKALLFPLYASRRIRLYLNAGYLFPLGIGLFVALFYTFLSGFLPPAQRALGALTLVVLLKISRRHLPPLAIWLRVCCAMILCDPLALLSGSFWLSVLAVLVLILWYRYFPLTRWIRHGSTLGQSWLMPFWRLLHLQLGMSLLFSLTQFLFFDGVSSLGWLANLLLVPLYSLVVPICFWALASDDLFGAWQLADWLVQFSVKLITPLADSWHWLDGQTQCYWLVLNLSLLCLLKAESLSRNRLVTGFGISALFFLSVWAFGAWQAKPKFEWITFDVGQGLANALLFEPKRAILFDTGGSWGAGSMAEIEILPYLRRNGIQVEAIFLSHDDNDHSGGMAALLRAFPHARFFSSSEQAYENRKPEACEAGRTWQFGALRLRALHPQKRVTRAKNQDSCVLLAEFGEFGRVLLTGDIRAHEELALISAILTAREQGQIDWLQVAHHGSKTSSNYAFLQAVQPKVAVLSVGRWNPWKMPHPLVLTRLAENQIQPFSTASFGQIRVQFEQKGTQIRTARTSYSPWYRQLKGAQTN